MEYQIYAYDANMKLNHAGTRKFTAITIGKLRKYEKAWEKWRLQYLKDNPGKYPLSETVDKTVLFVLHKIGESDKLMRIPI